MVKYRSATGLGAEIGRLRTATGLEQKDLAQRLAVHESAISRLEKGQRGLAVEELYALADLFGVAADTIVMDDQAEPALLRTAAAGDAQVERCLDALEAAIEDYFAAKALARFL